jgi:c-di-GMP-related signal transduction protein
MGLDMLCNGSRAFINCTRDMLLKDYITLLPSSHTVAEVLESVEADDLVMAACQRLNFEPPNTPTTPETICLMM